MSACSRGVHYIYNFVFIVALDPYTYTLLSSCSLNSFDSHRNPNFFPLRTPYPCLAIRYMVPGDFVFMTLDDYEPKLRHKLLKGFLDVFRGEDKKEVKQAEQIFDALDSELRQKTE